MAAKARKFGIYIRISQDRDGTAAAPARQLADCTALVERNGWTVHEVYEDRDESGYSTTAKRPAYHRMLADLESGVIDAVCVYRLDRLSRRMNETNRVIARIDELGAVFLSVSENFDTSDPMQRAVVGIFAAQAEQESANTSARIKRAVADQIADGKMPSGGSRCYGYTLAGDVIESEAASIREAARWFIDGTSYRQIAKRLNEAGSRTSNGNEWQGATIRHLLLSPRIGGYRLATDGRTLVRGSWQPILDADLYGSFHAAAAKAKQPAGRTEAAHLLTGFAFCGKCEGRLNALKWLDGSGKPFPRLSCTKNPGRPNCGKLAASEAALDRVVTERLLRRLDGAPILPSVDTEAIGQQLADDRRALDDLTRERFIKRTVDPHTFDMLSAELRAKIEEAERSLDNSLFRGVTMTTQALSASARSVTAEGRWKAADLVGKRSILRSRIEKVIVQPAARRGGNVFDESRVEVFWRGEH